jgi:hypothetical protein
MRSLKATDHQLMTDSWVLQPLGQHPRLCFFFWGGGGSRRRTSLPSHILESGRLFPFDYTVLGKRFMHSCGSSISPVPERTGEPAVITFTYWRLRSLKSKGLGSQLAGVCVPFCLGFIKFGKELPETHTPCAGPIQCALLLGLQLICLFQKPVYLPQDLAQYAVRRTFQDTRYRDLTF